MTQTPPLVDRLSSPVFLFVCKDGPAAVERRERDLEAHLAHVELHWRRYILAGPLRSPGESGICGSFFLVLADTADEAWAIMHGDPYVTSGQYQSIECFDAVPSIGQFIGGKIWPSADALRGRAAGKAVR